MEKELVIDIIELAESYSKEFNNSCIQHTSIAANILREHGHTVGELKEEHQCQ